MQLITSSLWTSQEKDMESENLHFRDDRHLTDLVKALDKLRIQEELCDIQLIADDGIVNAHKVLIASSCECVKQMLLKNGHTNLSSYRIEGVDKVSITAIVDYIYSGTMNITSEQVIPLFRAAKKLQIVTIANACSHYLQNNMEIGNCLLIRSLAAEYLCNALAQSADTYINNNMEQVARSEAFLALPRFQFEIYIDHDVDQSERNGERYSTEIVEWLHDNNYNLIQKQQKRLRESVNYLFSIEGNRLTDIDHLNEKQLKKIIDSVKSKALQSRNRNCLLFFDKARQAQSKLGTESSPTVRQLILTPEDASQLDWRVIAVAETSDEGFIALVAADTGNFITLSVHLKVAQEQGRSRTSSSCSSSSVNLSLLGPMQCGRCSQGVTVLNGEIYAVGGYDRLGCLSVIEKYNPFHNEWFTYCPMSRRQGRIAAAALFGYIYALGGSYSSQYLNSCERYNPITNEWEPVASMKTRRSCFNAAVVDDRIFAVGGQNSEGSINGVEVYNSSTNTWHTVKPMSAARSHLGVTAVPDVKKVYAVGGCDKWSTVINTAECYDIVKETWISIANMKLKRRGVGVAVYNGLIYACGGSDGSRPLNSIECFDPRANKWTLIKAQMNSCRANVGVANVDKWIYAVGGFDGSTFLNTVERYDPSREYWTSIVLPEDDIDVCQSD